MRISREQMARLQEHGARRHVNEILRFVRQQQPDATSGLADEILLDRIRWGLGRIRGAGVTDSRAAALFVVAQFAAGPTFHLHPACSALLADRRLPPDARVMTLFNADSGIPWGEINATRDDEAWMAAGPDGPP